MALPRALPAQHKRDLGGRVDLAQSAARLQATIGNQAVLRHQRRALPRGVQAKLKVGAVNDPLEAAADALAERVVRMPDPAIAHTAVPLDSAATTAPRVQRLCAGCEQDDEVRRKADGESATEGYDVATNVRAGTAGAGVTLPPDERAYFNPRFGFDFSQVSTAFRKAMSPPLVLGQPLVVASPGVLKRPCPAT